MASSPSRAIAWTGVVTGLGIPKKAEFTSWQILAVIPTSLDMTSPSFLSDTPGERISQTNSLYSEGRLGMNSTRETKRLSESSASWSRSAQARLTTALSVLGLQGLDRHWCVDRTER